MMMSYFETDDKAVLSVFCGSIGLVVFFWFLTKSVATAAPEWIAPLVILSLAAVYMIPTMRRMVVLIEDVDEISALFERTWREHENDEKKGPAPAKLARALSQPTADLRQRPSNSSANVCGSAVGAVARRSNMLGIPCSRWSSASLSLRMICHRFPVSAGM